MMMAGIDNLNLHLIEAIGKADDHDDIVSHAVPLVFQLVKAWNKIDIPVPIPDVIEGIPNNQMMMFMTHFSTNFKSVNDGEFVLRNLKSDGQTNLKVFLTNFVDKSFKLSEKIKSGEES